MTKRKAATQTSLIAERRSNKKRKAAEAGAAKLKEIVKAEEAIDEEEVNKIAKEAVQRSLQKCPTAGETTNEVIEVPGYDDDEPVKETSLAHAPGFRFWKTTSALTSGGELSALAQYNETTEKFSHVLDIQYKDAFTIKPLVVASGPYQGRRVFMLEPIDEAFRFRDFPAEIRTMIYSFLLEDDKPVKMSSHKIVNEPRRPVRAGIFRSRRSRATMVNGARQPSNNATILQLSKEIHQETAPILYGDNHFHFTDFSDLKIFLDRIGSMSKHLRHIYVGNCYYSRNKAVSVFNGLKNSTGLRTLSFNHATLCSNTYERYESLGCVNLLPRNISPLMKILQRAQKDSDSPIDVLDIVKVVWEKCNLCRAATPNFSEDCQAAHGYGRCRIKCAKLEEHREEMENKMRVLIAKQLGIEE